MNQKIPALQAKPSKTVKPNGHPDAEFIIGRLVDAWDDLQEKVMALNDGDKEKIEEYFNQLIEDENDLGTVLFGTAEDFDSRFRFLSSENKELYTRELVFQKVIDLDLVMVYSETN